MAPNRLQWPQVKLTVPIGGALLLTTAPTTFPTGEADCAEWRRPLPLAAVLLTYERCRELFHAQHVPEHVARGLISKRLGEEQKAFPVHSDRRLVAEDAERGFNVTRRLCAAARARRALCLLQAQSQCMRRRPPETVCEPNPQLRRVVHGAVRQRAAQGRRGRLE